MNYLTERLRALSRSEHDDHSVADEAADEIKRLRAELDYVHDYYTGAIERNVEATAERCTEIVDNFSYAGAITQAIRQEFGLGEQES